MSVPTHNLYDFIHQVLEKKYVIAYFYPYGEKKLDFLRLLIESEHYYLSNIVDGLSKQDNACYKIFPESLITTSEIYEFSPWIVCNDQEPLDYDYYADNHNHYSIIQNHKSYSRSDYEIQQNWNFRWIYAESFQKKWIVLHSELNSKEVEKYNANEKFTCAYWWSHAMISRDWYRFAEYDKFLQPASNLKKLFLIYSQGTSGSRKYRIKFLDQIKHLKQCQLTSFIGQKNNPTLSAEYNYFDFNSTAFSVVLETIFDDRIHLTEKTLRPIAVGHPFIIANGPGTLDYLRSYGFKTFSPWINESYDLETDNSKRLGMIVKEIERLENLSPEELKKVIKECLKIAKHNKKIFFSKNFFNKIINELCVNIKKCKVNEFNWQHIWEHRKFRKKKNPLFYKNKKLSKYFVKFMWHIKKGGTLENYVPPDLD